MRVCVDILNLTREDWLNFHAILQHHRTLYRITFACNVCNVF